jgi:hypothetical protein
MQLIPGKASRWIPYKSALVSLSVFQQPIVYFLQHNGQLSIEEFYFHSGNKLEPNNRWVLLSAMIPWGELEEKYASLFNATIGAPRAY